MFFCLHNELRWLSCAVSMYILMNCIGKNYFNFIVASNIYSESMESKRDIGADGLQSSIGFRIYRINSESISPFIPLVRKVACIDHCAARVTETLINLTLETVVSRKDVASEESLAGVDIFCRNLAARDIHQMDRVGVVDGKLKVTAKPRVPNHYIDRVYMNWIGTVFGSISAQTGKGLVTTTQNYLYES